ncbi:DNA cytosine methyltransferase, partial [Acinetobacter baumannii]
YVVDWRKDIVAADYGAGTIRERLFMVARCDNKPILWPERLFSKLPSSQQNRWIPTAVFIDWDDLGKSIFNRSRGPLAEATLK